jgi:hypothetical protein
MKQTQDLKNQIGQLASGKFYVMVPVAAGFFQKIFATEQDALRYLQTN